MYSEKTPRERDVDFVLPIAKRKIIISEDECLQEGYFGFDPSMMKEEYLKELELIYLTRMNESVSQITDAYPIVKYYSENTDSLNRFVESITVAVVSGKKLCFDERYTPKEEIIDDDVVAYITNPFNVSTEIYYYDLCKLLYQRPMLTVTNEGVLLFYTSTTLFATLDCRSGNIISIKELAEAVGNKNITKISSIAVTKDGTTVIKFKTTVGEKDEHQLSMFFDFFSECGVTVKID